VVNVILTGMRGTGKSSIGIALAARLGFTFCDTDQAIERLAGRRIAAIVAQDGWEHFRELERQVVSQIAAQDQQVIAVGGGTLIDADNAMQLKAHGVVVLLVCDLAVLQRRIGSDGNRPSLTGQGSAVAELAEVWQVRRERYHAVADVTYDVTAESQNTAQDVQQKAAALHALLQQHRGWTAGVAVPPL
jgi:shikimate kinase